MKTKTNKAFTIVELLVAMALVVILMGLSSLVFTTGVKAHRTADSTVEVVRRAESICQELSSDLRGLQTNAPMAIWFEAVDTDGDGNPDTQYDQMQFFANGDFQTIKQYDSNADGFVDKTVSGLVARIYYGHAWQVNTATAPWTFGKSYGWVSSVDRGARLFSRRAHLLTSDLTLTYPGLVTPFPNPVQFTTGGFPPLGNTLVEYDQLSLMNWQTLVQTQANCDQLLQVCFNDLQNTTTAGRPMIDMKNAETLHLLLSEQISSFQVQWAYKVEDLSTSATAFTPIPATSTSYFTGVRWWPSGDPAGDGTVNSDFLTMGQTQFGAYFQMPGGSTNTSWYRVKPQATETSGEMASQRCRSQIGYFRQDYYPKAMKFTFTVHDVKGLFPEGRTFTHIVYIEN